MQPQEAALFSYFEYKLKKEGIDPKPFPIEYEGEVVATEYPPDLFYLSEDLEDALKRYDSDYEADECEERVISIYESYCKKYYTSKKITYFDDYALKQVLKQSEERKKWDKKFDSVNRAKEEFIKLKIAK